jgi:hypothetical protein
MTFYIGFLYLILKPIAFPLLFFYNNNNNKANEKQNVTVVNLIIALNSQMHDTFVCIVHKYIL